MPEDYPCPIETFFYHSVNQLVCSLEIQLSCFVQPGTNPIQIKLCDFSSDEQLAQRRVTMQTCSGIVFTRDLYKLLTGKMSQARLANCSYNGLYIGACSIISHTDPEIKTNIPSKSTMHLQIWISSVSKLSENENIPRILYIIYMKE